MLCAVVADTREHAKRGAAAVKISYEDLSDPVFTIQVSGEDIRSHCREFTQQPNVFIRILIYPHVCPLLLHLWMVLLEKSNAIPSALK